MSAVAFSGLIARRGFGPSLRVSGGRTTQNLGMTGQTVGNNSWDQSVPITVAYLRAETRSYQLFSVTLLGLAGYLYQRCNSTPAEASNPEE